MYVDGTIGIRAFKKWYVSLCPSSDALDFQIMDRNTILKSQQFIQCNVLTIILKISEQILSKVYCTHKIASFLRQTLNLHHTAPKFIPQPKAWKCRSANGKDPDERCVRAHGNAGAWIRQIERYGAATHLH